MKTLALTAIIAALFSTSILAQPSPENNTSAMAFSSRLEKFMNSTEQSIKYIAPEAALDESTLFEISDKETEEAIQNLDRLAWNIDNAIKYKVPYDNVEEPVMTFHKIPNHPVKIEFYNTSKDAWLINAGYYKTTRTPAWSKVKKMFSAREANREFADKD